MLLSKMVLAALGGSDIHTVSTASCGCFIQLHSAVRIYLLETTTLT